MFRVILRHYLSNKPDMKRILKIVYSSIIILIVPFSMALGQDKKSEQKIKIIVDDGSGSKVIIDTVYNDEVKAKELVKEIENKLGVNNEGTEKKETVKVISKKSVKK